VPDWSPERVAAAAGATLAAAPDHARPGPRRAVIDSRDAGPGDLFAGLVGEHVDGGRFAPDTLRTGAWGVLVGPGHAEAAAAAADPGGVVLVAGDPLAALQRLATAWRRELACPVVGVTGSVGKTSTKDLLAAMLAPALRVTANRLNLNTEIGLPLTILGAPRGTEAVVLEMGMRGAGQISELAALAQPDVGVITAIAPVHLEQLGTLEAIAAEKAALVAALPAGGTAVVPAGEALLAAHLRPELTTVTFGPGGDVDEADLAGLELPFTAAHMRRNACAALAAARALGVEPAGRVDVQLSELRGQRITLPGRITVINDCYNANPVSMRAALDDLAASAGGRRVAVLGDMRELGPDEARFHEEIGRYARERGVELLVAVGPLSRAYAGDHHLDTAADAAALVPGLLHEGDTLLVKASRGVGLEAVAEALA
jgi:UDP-N-acetylmuramoyl-tripeptide--D-alanyl-D-alanine ligase